MSILTLEQVSKTYGDRVVLDEVSLSLDADSRLGLLGVNGSGKTTLLRILAGAEEPDHGRVVRRRDLVIGYLEQEPRFEPGSNVQQVLEEALQVRARLLRRIEALDARLAQAGPASGSGPGPAGFGSALQLEALLKERAELEEALERAGGWEVGHRLSQVSDALALPPRDAAVDFLSGGERRRLAIARLLLEGPDLLVLDEPTNHLDVGTIDWLESFLAGWRGALVLVSHDRYFLERLVTEIAEIDRTRLHRHRGSYSGYLEQRAARLEAESKSESSRVNLLRRELEWMRRGPKARTHKQRARQQRYDALVQAAPTAQVQPLSLCIPDGPTPGKQILDLFDVSKSYGSRTLIRDLTLRTKLGDRIGIVGPNGAGKTTLLRLILGEEQPDRGRIEIGASTRLVYNSQTRTELDPELTVYQAVAENTDHVTIAGERVHIRGYLSRFLFPPQLQEAKVGRLSGGERNRLQLARLLRDGGNVILLDEPTNDLDLMTLRVLEEALAAFGGVVLLVSHDRYLLNRVATAILAFEEDGRITLYEGDYDFYAERRAEERALQASPPGPAARAEAPPPKERQKPPARRRLTIPERRELENMEGAILEAERQVADLAARLEDPAIYQERPLEIPKLVSSLEQAQGRVDALYARWAELAALDG